MAEKKENSKSSKVSNEKSTIYGDFYLILSGLTII